MPTQFCNYTIQAELGQGGMATVYRAKNQRGEPVALKVMAADLRDSPPARERFRREARMHPRHPNVVQILDSGECEGAPYIAMQLIEGESLERVLRRMKMLAAEQFAPILEDICAALDAAHGQGIIHRDIKPSNILLRASDGRAFLSDFGVAKDVLATRLTLTGSAGMGTAAFMSPEQARGHNLTPASDVYSLGVLAYEVLCGQLPFQADDLFVLMRMHIQDVPPDVRSRNPRISAGVAGVVMRALSKEPTQRYASAGAFAQAFARALPRSAPQGDGKRDSQDVALPAWAWASGGALIAVAFFAMGALIFGRINPAPSPTPVAQATNIVVVPPSPTPDAGKPTLAAAAGVAAKPTSTLAPAGVTATEAPTAEAPGAAANALSKPTTLPKNNLVAPKLISPAAGTRFMASDPPSFSWSAAGTLAADEYYVLAALHEGGEDDIWTKDLSATLRDRWYLGSAGTRIQSWLVCVARNTNLRPANVCTKGNPLVSSEQRPVTWVIPATVAPSYPPVTAPPAPPAP